MDRFHVFPIWLSQCSTGLLRRSCSAVAVGGAAVKRLLITCSYYRFYAPREASDGRQIANM